MYNIFIWFKVGGSGCCVHRVMVSREAEMTGLLEVRWGESQIEISMGTSWIGLNKIRPLRRTWYLDEKLN